ncbi:MAG: hypothetical protein ACI87N_000915, partial [Flavobacteriales bacterium]
NCTSVYDEISQSIKIALEFSILISCIALQLISYFKSANTMFATYLAAAMANALTILDN